VTSLAGACGLNGTAPDQTGKMLERVAGMMAKTFNTIR
jgi:hypothetical protein